jgi:hypothetical protein
MKQWSALRKPIVLCLLTVICSIAQAADTATNCAADSAAASTKTNQLVVRADNLPPSTTTNVKSVTVCSLNIFRFDVHIQAQENVSNPQAPLTSLFPALSNANVAAAAAPKSAGSQSPPRKAEGAHAPAAPASYGDFLAAVTAASIQATNKANGFADAQTVAAAKQTCFSDVIRLYPALLLIQSQRKTLIQAVQACHVLPEPAWDNNSVLSVQQDITSVITLNSQIALFQTTDTYISWLGTAGPLQDARKTQFANLLTTNVAVLTQLQGILNSPNLATYNVALRALTDWDTRSDFISSANAPWDQTLALPCRAQWFGKTDGQIVTLQYIDTSLATTTPQPSPLFTNACLPSLTVTTGLGISTVRSSTFAFVPKTNFGSTPPVTTQAIGYSTDSRIVPLFVGQMNYGYFQRSVGLHVSGGAGVGTSSSGTTGDFFIGNAFSFFHRAIFVTPAAHFTQRQRLMSGYSLGDPQGSLTSVPTINGWAKGFAITITLPVLQ